MCNRLFDGKNFRYKKFRKFLRKAFDDLGNPDDMVELSVIRNSIQVCDLFS